MCSLVPVIPQMGLPGGAAAAAKKASKVPGVVQTQQ